MITHLRLLLGLSRRRIVGNFNSDDKEIQGLMEKELMDGTILHYGRRRVYEHLRRQGYLIAR